jgi:hypothetical protein
VHGALIALDEREVSVINTPSGDSYYTSRIFWIFDTSFCSLCLSNLFLNTFLDLNVGIRPFDEAGEFFTNSRDLNLPCVVKSAQF